ncbi:MAG: hypothetical protein AAFX08_01775 [Pseudomonadota bacterium]
MADSLDHQASASVDRIAPIALVAADDVIVLSKIYAEILRRCFTSPPLAREG